MLVPSWFAAHLGSACLAQQTSCTSCILLRPSPCHFWGGLDSVDSVLLHGSTALLPFAAAASAWWRATSYLAQVQPSSFDFEFRCSNNYKQKAEWAFEEEFWTEGHPHLMGAPGAALKTCISNRTCENALTAVQLFGSYPVGSESSQSCHCLSYLLFIKTE